MQFSVRPEKFSRTGPLLNLSHPDERTRMESRCSPGTERKHKLRPKSNTRADVIDPFQSTNQFGEQCPCPGARQVMARHRNC